MKIGIPAEITEGEQRVAATPDTVERLQKLGYEVHVQAGAGRRAGFPDADYVGAGATIVEERDAVWSYADLVLKVQPPALDAETDDHEAELLREHGVLVSLIDPARNEALLERLAKRKATVLALDCVPRITRAQSVDVLSSMASIAGYRAVIEAADSYGGFFGPQVTAAGSTPPARVLVIGAGVAGLSAIATAKELGARVRAFDVRPAVKEEVESLGAEFLELDFDTDGAESSGGYANPMSDEFIEAEMALFAEEVPASDIVITTASIPGKSAPKLVLSSMVEAMDHGSVIVDLAAESGGNCELTEPGEAVTHNGVSILGYTNLTSRLAGHASEYFGRNLVNLVGLFGEADAFEVDEDDAVIRGMLVLRDGELKWPPPEIEPTRADGGQPQSDEPSAPPEAADEVAVQGDDDRPAPAVTATLVGLGAALMGVVGVYAPPDFVQHFTVFVLACFVGWQVVWNVTPSLHTPLMSVTNAISAIIIVGGLLLATVEASTPILALAAAAIFVASINVFGGFLVTKRMLGMFRAQEGGK